MYDLPHLSKKITPSTRKKAETNLSKVFNIPLSSLKQNEYLSKPVVYITYIPFINRYRGFIKIGNTVSQFKTIKTIPDNLNLNSSSLNNNTQSTLILTCYFTLNNIPFRSNIFILNNGSILQYSSMTIQDSNDNVIGMFTYGKSSTLWQKGNTNRNTNNSSATNTQTDYVWESEKVIKHNVKFTSINDPFGNLGRFSEPANRLDAMVNTPFNNLAGATNSFAARSWAFKTQIENAYTNFYHTAGYGNVYTYAYINDIDNIIDMRFPSEINESNLYPEESGYSSVPINISFTLLGVGSIGYSINVPYSGVRKVWTLQNTFGSAYPYNYGKYSAFPCNTFTWDNPDLFWKISTYDAETNNNPGSYYSGFYCRYSAAMYASGSYMYVLYASEVNYGIKVVSTTYNRVDYYYLSVSQEFPYVNVSGN